MASHGTQASWYFCCLQCVWEWWMDRLEKGKDNGKSCMTRQGPKALLRAIDKYFEQKRKTERVIRSVLCQSFLLDKFLFIHFVLFLISNWLQTNTRSYYTSLVFSLCHVPLTIRVNNTLNGPQPIQWDRSGHYILRILKNIQMLY